MPAHTLFPLFLPHSVSQAGLARKRKSPLLHPQLDQSSQLMHTHEDPLNTGPPWSPHLCGGGGTDQHQRQRSLCLGAPACPARLPAALAGCSTYGTARENSIRPDTQHRWPRPRQALGDKGPLLSSAGPGTGTGPAQCPWVVGHPGLAEGCEGLERNKGRVPHPSPPPPSPFALSFACHLASSMNLRVGDILELTCLPGEELGTQRGTVSGPGLAPFPEGSGWQG